MKRIKYFLRSILCFPVNDDTFNKFFLGNRVYLHGGGLQVAKGLSSLLFSDVV